MIRIGERGKLDFRVLGGDGEGEGVAGRWCGETDACIARPPDK